MTDPLLKDPIFFFANAVVGEGGAGREVGKKLAVAYPSTEMLCYFPVCTHSSKPIGFDSWKTSATFLRMP